MSDGDRTFLSTVKGLFSGKKPKEELVIKLADEPVFNAPFPAAKSSFYDSGSVFNESGILRREGVPLTAKDLRAMASNPIISAIINTRLGQISSFCYPKPSTYESGYEIVPKNPEYKVNLREVNALKNWILNCGAIGFGESSFESLVRKMVRDSLTLDQTCVEVVSRRNGKPAYLVAVDSSTIVKLRASLNYFLPTDPETPYYAQVIDDKIVASYGRQDMIFGVRNGQTDLEFFGYGKPELESLIRVVTTIINTERFNASQLSQGGTSKGILIVKGDVDPESFAIFKKEFRAILKNASKSWVPPILKVSSDSSVDWKTLDRSNRDMEYAQLFDFLIKQSCGAYQIDPSEINWTIGATGSTTTFESKSNGKVAASKEKGLKPLLAFIAGLININVIDRLNPNYKLVFTPVSDNIRETSVVRDRQVRSYKTRNELRSEVGLPYVGKKGDIILDPHLC
jgi:hypothetical protein